MVVAAWSYTVNLEFLPVGVSENPRGVRPGHSRPPTARVCRIPANAVAFPIGSEHGDRTLPRAPASVLAPGSGGGAAGQSPILRSGHPQCFTPPSGARDRRCPCGNGKCRWRFRLESALSGPRLIRKGPILLMNWAVLTWEATAPPEKMASGDQSMGAARYRAYLSRDCGVQPLPGGCGPALSEAPHSN